MTMLTEEGIITYVWSQSYFRMTITSVNHSIYINLTPNNRLMRY